MKAIQVEDGVHKAVKLKCLENEVGIAVITEALLLAWVEGKVQIAVPKPVVRQVKEIAIGEPKRSGSKVAPNPHTETSGSEEWRAEDKVEVESQSDNYFDSLPDNIDVEEKSSGSRKNTFW